MSFFRLSFSLACAVVVLVACGGGDDASSAPAEETPVTLGDATLSGKIVAPNGSTPLANALVYVEGSSQAGDLPAGEAGIKAVPPAETCGLPPNPTWSYTCTGVDGSFNWVGKIPPAAKLVAVKGAFKLEKVLSASGGTVALGTLAIPTGPASTRMAVVTGYFDSVQDVLAKLGFGEVTAGRLKPGTEQFDLFDGTGAQGGTTKSMSALFVDADNNGKADIFNYAIVFLNCGLEAQAATHPAWLQILRDYVVQGGRLYVSDQAYDFVEQSFPAYLDFHGSDSTAAAVAEEPGAAAVGTGGITSKATLDPALRAWMGGISCASGPCLNTDNTATIEGFLDYWVIMNGPQAGAPSAARVWVQGPVLFNGQTVPANKPLTVTFNVGSGRVTYTSYHNEPQFNGAGFVPVERILQFLVFEL